MPDIDILQNLSFFEDNCDTVQASSWAHGKCKKIQIQTIFFLAIYCVHFQISIHPISCAAWHGSTVPSAVKGI